MSLLLAGDIGGTKTMLGVFERGNDRPRSLGVRSFGTLDFPDLTAMAAAFLTEIGADTIIDPAAFGVAGPILGPTAKLTNADWQVDATAVGNTLSIPHVRLLNDLEAMGYAIPALLPSEVETLQVGLGSSAGNMALIAPGTGLGEALLHNVDGRFVPSASESGHADFAARTEREIRVLRDLTARFGRASVEHVVSGRGFVHIHRALSASGCAANIDLDAADAPAAISAAALERRCQTCQESLEVFVEALGAETGNLALRSLATGGVYIGGGIPPKILSALKTEAFIQAFRAKAPLEGLMSRVPVKVIVNAEAGLLGAAIYSAAL